jgi:hypothetical protein
MFDSSWDNPWESQSKQGTGGNLVNTPIEDGDEQKCVDTQN